MINFYKGQGEQSMLVTLTEMVTLENPYFLFVFTPLSEGTPISIVFSSEEDVSSSKERYNEFLIDVDEIFEGRNAQKWSYEVYQQESESNTNVALAGALIENGNMSLWALESETFTEHSTDFIFKMHNQ